MHKNQLEILEKFIVEIKKTKPSTDELNIKMDRGREDSTSEMENKTEEYAQDVAQKVKEVKFHINIDQHDYETKIKHVQDFFEKGFRVKVTLALRGREMAHQDMAYELMNRVVEELVPIADPDGKPKMMGRNISVGFTPKSGTVKKAPAAEDDLDDIVEEDVETSETVENESEE